MINRELYGQLEEELKACGIEEEAEDVLLDLSEVLADKGVMEKELHHSEKYGRTLIEICGICTPDEDDPGETGVLLRWIKIGKKTFDIDDYFL